VERSLGACAPELAAHRHPAGIGHLAVGADERFGAHLGTPPLRPAQEEPRFADLDRTAADDGNPLPRPVEDEGREQDGDDEGHRLPPR
jgi:hypothetical protein